MEGDGRGEVLWVGILEQITSSSWKLAITVKDNLTNPKVIKAHVSRFVNKIKYVVIKTKCYNSKAINAILANLYI